MSRNRERQQELQPGRVDYARTRLEALGYPVTEVNATTLQFTFRGSPVTLYPYSGWFTGRTITDGRGIKNLLKPITMQIICVGLHIWKIIIILLRKSD